MMTTNIMLYSTARNIGPELTAAVAVTDSGEWCAIILCLYDR